MNKKMQEAGVSSARPEACRLKSSLLPDFC